MVEGLSLVLIISNNIGIALTKLFVLLYSSAKLTRDVFIIAVALYRLVISTACSKYILAESYISAFR
ncbi:hypothetical protein SDC9_206797 [bioreactor metagenome]|uniref:Uncharacterized protein n=1 Tax=bioreactor metagenome TaxID=1076179 RepID=A0A645J8P8_9ZZZZ